MKILVHLSLGLLCLVALVPLTSAQNQRPPAVVEVATVVEKNIAPSIWVPGTVISREDSNVASEVAGVLNFVAEVGTRVKKGQVLARVNDRQLQLQLRQNQAEIARLQSRYAFAQRQLERTVSLAESNSTAKFRIEELEMERDVLGQEIALAEVARDQTKYLLNRSKIEAPFPGVVAGRFAEPGEHISVGEELLRLVNTGALEISAQAPVDVSRFISANDTIMVKAGDTQLTTKLRSLIPVGDVRSRMVEVRIQLEGDWVIGDAVSVSLYNGRGELAKTIPRDALVLRDNDVFVFRINAEGIAEKINVVPGIGDASNIAVSGPLEQGDIIVTRGAERLDDGSKVNMLNPVANR